MRPLDDLLRESGSLHGHLCPGQILGVRMAMLGCRLVGVDEPTQTKELIVFVEIDRCATDAIQAVTGCKLGKRTLKYLDYGKVAATFFNTTTSAAIRISACDDSREKAWNYTPQELDKKAAQKYAYKVMPDNELFDIMPVRIDLSPYDLPGHPVGRVFCNTCGEGINDGREVWRSDKTLCRPCAEGAYYRPVELAALP